MAIVDIARVEKYLKKGEVFRSHISRDLGINYNTVKKIVAYLFDEGKVSLTHRGNRTRVRLE